MSIYTTIHGRPIPYHIGEYYRRLKSNQRMKLESVNHRFGLMIFSNGERLSYCVFEDLVRVNTDVQVYKEPIQLTLFNQ